MFATDEFTARRSVFQKNLKNTDRLLWIDYGIAIDDQTLRHIVSRDWKWNGMIFPCVQEGIDWDRFRKEIDTTEPASQKGLSFDTQVTTKVTDDIYNISATNPKSFCVDTKPFLKNMKKVTHNLEELFSDLMKTNFKLVAFTGARLTATYPHECIGNILGAAGVKANKA